jgi:hypothetical protein
MPCMCWTEPSDEEKAKFKFLCQLVVDHIKECNRRGDPLGIDVEHAQELIAHLYNPDLCKEKGS